MKSLRLALKSKAIDKEIEELTTLKYKVAIKKQKRFDRKVEKLKKSGHKCMEWAESFPGQNLTWCEQTPCKLNKFTHLKTFDGNYE